MYRWAGNNPSFGTFTADDRGWQEPAAAPATCGLSLAPGAGAAGTAWALSSAARAERTADTATVSRARSASRRARSSRFRIPLSGTPAT